MSQVSANAAYSSDAHSYHDFLTILQSQFTKRLSAEPTTARLFTTELPAEKDGTLFELFLSGIPARDQQFYTCNACRRFVNTFGGLVTIDSEGNTSSAIWGNSNDIPDYFAYAVTGLREYVEARRVNAVFLSSDKVWGNPTTGTWSHMAIRPAPELLYTGRIKTADQMMAEKREDYRNMITALEGGEFNKALSPDTLNTAVTLLESDALFRSEKVMGVAAWLKSLQGARDRAKHRNRENILWRAVALAPIGYCHPRSSMIGTLLQDIEDGYVFKDIERRFRAKMDGLQYQRAQVAPGAQNIVRAEEIVVKLGIAASLKRRFARLDEVVAIWTPSTKQKAQPTRKGGADGVFANVAAKNEPLPIANMMTMPVTTMTVEKFRRTVLPNARSIEFWVPGKVANYTALVTAEDMTAPPILQWDREDARNPVSSYVYHQGSMAADWNLIANTLCKVTAISDYPAMWEPKTYLPHMGGGLVMLLDGARDKRYRTSGAALFPEILKADLREVRSTIEAFSKKAMISGYDASSACGLMLSAKGKAGHRFRVTTDTTTTDYELDRWD